MIEENQELKMELKSSKALLFHVSLHYQSRLSKMQEMMKNEMASREKQLRDLTASLLLLESQLQKEKKKSAENRSTIRALKIENAKLTEFVEGRKGFKKYGLELS